MDKWIIFDTQRETAADGAPESDFDEIKAWAENLLRVNTGNK